MADTKVTPFTFPPRLDRVIALEDLESYPGSPFIDTVFYWPVQQADAETQVRFWLRARGQDLRLELNKLSMEPCGYSATDPTWIDLGIHSAAELKQIIKRFGILRLFGLDPDSLSSGLLAMTTQTELKFKGGRSEAEKALWGISRAEAGTTTLSPSSLEVGCPSRFRMRYTAGADLPPGAMIRLTFPKLFSAPNLEITDGPGALFVEEADSSLETIFNNTSPESHERIDVVYRLSEGLSKGGCIEFLYQTDASYLFPRRWTTMERRYWYSHLPVMAAAVAVDNRGLFTPPEETNGHALEILPGPPARLHLFLPGRVRNSARITLHGLFTDRYRNSPPRRGVLGPDFTVRLEGTETVELGSPAQHFRRWYQFKFDMPAIKPGIYRARAIETGTGKTLALSNPLEIMPPDDARDELRWGEIHGHCEQSDGSGDFAEMFTHARDIGCLDFAASGDHACYFSDNEWQWMQDVINEFNDDGGFVTLIGYEWAGRQGHRNIYTDRERLELFRGMHPGTEHLDDVYPQLAGDTHIVAGPHTQHTQDFFAGHHPDVQRFLEICSMWGSFEDIAFGALEGGAHIGLTGGGDCHEGRCGFSVEDPDRQGTRGHTFAPGLRYKCGITGALLPALTRTELLQALRQGKTIATTGPRMLLDLTIDGNCLGQQVTVHSPPHIRVEIRACNRLDRIDIIRNGQIVHSHSRPGTDAELGWTDAELEPGSYWYLAKAVQEDGETAWTSPIWLTLETS